MADMLARFEEQVRQTERLRTLGQLSGALAHQLRNAVTGAKIALDIHQDECPLGGENESMEVAARQLVLMEKYVKKLLSIGAPAERAHQQLDFGQLVGSLLPLVRPAAQHVGVDFEAELPSAPLLVRGDQDALEHLVLNLMLNGIEAAAARRAADHAAPARVALRLEGAGQDQLLLIVEDTGSGPADDVARRVFEPFVTDKPDGVGLGLAVAQQVAARHGGGIHWKRAGGRTRFVAQIPLIAERTLRVEAAGG
jgi:signal transduction histidine kinase